MAKLGKISTDESKNFKVARWIHGRDGFSTDTGSLESSNQVSAYALVPHNFLCLRWHTNPMVMYLDLETSKNWVMHVYGRPMLGRCQALAQGLAKEFNVHIHVKLVQEVTGLKSYVD